MEQKKKIIVIAGPTATGKTKLSIDIAKAYGGEIVSSDSVQIYKRLDIGSAKPTKEEMSGITHHLIDILEPYESFSVADFVERAKDSIEDILSRGKLPIVVGGTGLYISSLVDNVSFSAAETDHTLRGELNKRAETEGVLALYEELKKTDPVAAENIHPNNIKRVIRALEIYYQTGKTMTEHNTISKLTESPYDAKMYALSSDRELIYERINKRVDIMVKDGLLEEVSALLESGITKDMQSMQAIGYKEIIAYLEGDLSKDAAIDLVKQNSRHYAKRQLTWFKRDERYTWLDINDKIDITKLVN
ncbi:MAG: tRNA (adenosine(37)-N6)-dimethylallyltransferase MiaA [Clostridia bacterium]|nr:tRNA (adenosine(37)-N6)-dimethylallyltransferase MiaA [Clostridia bacterium]MBR6647466.1 tRNA (adenosine(37)-N6)-dimethylallyltransferase MiaA [Clostridia bacterium]